MEFRSPTYGIVENKEALIDKMFEKILSNEDSKWTIAIGTDSQNKKDMTRFCSVILLLEKGKGGTYFYKTHSEKRLHVIQNRMLREAELSINIGKDLLKGIDNKLLSDDLFEKNVDIAFEIHCDLGNYGKSRDSIKTAIGWISAEFGELVATKIKPDSAAASCIADKYTR